MNKKRKILKKIWIYLLTASLIIFSWCLEIAAQTDESYYVPDESGISLNSGYTYDPSADIYFLQVSLYKLYDYDRVWRHKAPDNLRFKVEGAVGGAHADNNIKLIANIGVLALLYLDKLESNLFKPYVEAGIGAVYTDYRVTGQDYCFNFNPQIGIGIEFKRDKSPNRFIFLRMHHISNGGISSSNRGQNSIVFAFGQYF
jgi:lipid A 3-O-deacylase